MKKKKNLLKICIVVYLVILVAMYIYIYLIPRVSNFLVKSYIAEYGVLEVYEESPCLFVRDEVLFISKNSGAISDSVSQNKLVRKGAKILAVGQQGYNTDKGGLVSYYWDGLEEKMTPDKIPQIRESHLNGIIEDQEFKIQKCVKKDAVSGDKLFKIIDNKSWYLICWLDKEKSADITKDKTIYVGFEDVNEPIQMTVSSIEEEGEKTKIVLSCNRYYENYGKKRVETCKIIKTRKSGLIVENQSITTEDGKKGVYILNKHGKKIFTPISVLASDDKVSVVEKNYYYDAEGNRINTIVSYQEIIRNPNEDEK